MQSDYSLKARVIFARSFNYYKYKRNLIKHLAECVRNIARLARKSTIVGNN